MPPNVPDHPAERVIPRRLPDRLPYFEALWEAIELDALATVDELRSNGWPDGAIAAAMEDYLEWLRANLVDAVALGRIAGGVAA